MGERKRIRYNFPDLKGCPVSNDCARKGCLFDKIFKNIDLIIEDESAEGVKITMLLTAMDVGCKLLANIDSEDSGA